jgi:hypothetical protein
MVQLSLLRSPPLSLATVVMTTDRDTGNGRGEGVTDKGDIEKCLLPKMAAV